MRREAGREILAFAILFLTAFLLVSLYSARPEDTALEGFFGSKVKNVGGPLGAMAAAEITAWMGSAGHRENLLSGDYTEVGLGLALGTPSDQTWGATYTTDFTAGTQAPAPAKTGAASKARKKAKRPTVCAGAASARRGAKPRSSPACRSARVHRR